MVETLIERVKFLTKKYQILPCNIINPDETPMYWEFLPRHIVFPKGAKIVPNWKSSNSHKRSTLLLECTSEGSMLRPTLILKRDTPYTLRCNNSINLLIQNIENDWTTSSSFKDWIRDALAPYLQGKHGILIIDSYEGHKSEEVRVFVNTYYANIHCIVIPGGYTDILQPLDLGVNSVFKGYCKQESLEFTNKQIMKYQENVKINSEKINLNLVTGKKFF